MNWTAVVGVIAVLNLLATIAGTFYKSGRVSEKVDGVSRQTADHAEKLEKHEQRLGAHDVALAQLGYEVRGGA